MGAYSRRFESSGRRSWRGRLASLIACVLVALLEPGLGWDEFRLPR